MPVAALLAAWPAIAGSSPPLAPKDGFPPIPAGPAGGGRFHRGVVFGLFAKEEPRHLSRGLDEIAGLGADSISIMIPWVTPDVRSTEMAPRSDMTPRDETLRAAIRSARGRGMSVLLMPFLYVDRVAPGEWRGALAPSDWARWFASYEAMILRYARIAHSERAEILSIGSELCSTEGRREDWLRLIGRVRRIYGGALTYSANWDHLEDLSFAPELDYLGMNAYFELSSDPDPSVDSLAAAWRPIIGGIEAWRAGAGKPLLLTEVGYPSRDGACADPWNYGRKGPADTGEQERCYRAFVEGWAGYPALAGVYFYHWWGEGGPADTGYTPRGKPARKVIEKWYRGADTRKER